MDEEIRLSGADHPHVENWASNPPVQAGKHLALGIHGGRRQTWEGRATYGFLDGHAETLPFADVFRSFQRNKFDPAVAR